MHSPSSIVTPISDWMVKEVRLDAWVGRGVDEVVDRARLAGADAEKVQPEFAPSDAAPYLLARRGEDHRSGFALDSNSTARSQAVSSGPGSS